jgi:hypothetical protein
VEADNRNNLLPGDNQAVEEAVAVEAVEEANLWQDNKLQDKQQLCPLAQNPSKE